VHGSPRSDRVSPSGVWRAGAQLGLIVTGALTVGGLTSWGQQLLPDALAPLANSASGWTLFTVLLLLRAGGGMRVSMVGGAAGFLGLSVGYALVSTARGYFFDPSFWVVVGVIAGPIIGAAVALARRTEPWARVSGTAVVAGVMAGEGVYGLLFVASTTGWFYWTLMIAVGAVIVVTGAVRLRSSRRSMAALVASTAVMAAAFPAAFLLLGASMR